MFDIAAFGANKTVSPKMRRLHDMQMRAAVSTGGASTQLGTDGAFMIQKDFTTELLESTFSSGAILSRCDTHEVGPNADGLEVVVLDETSRATGSRWGGVQVYWGDEADSATAKKPKFSKWESRLADVIGAAYMTERLLQDAPSIASVFSAGFTEEFQFVVEDAVIRGTGVGQPVGIIGHAATFSVAKETGQIASTIVAENIQKMWKSVHPRSRSVGMWCYNVECEPQLQNMMIGTGTSGQLVYMPPGGLSGAPYGSIYGRPVLPCEYCAGLGTVGDIFFANFQRYKIITKGGLQSDDSIHVRFLNNERTFRWLTRVNGAPKDRLTITPYKAADSAFRLAHIVTLATRA